jgi:ABC-type transport system involved in multi-copper enzyme maturation permease subunit
MSYTLADIGDSLPRMGWIISACIVVVGLLGLGLTDLLRFSATRVWAIGGVCFRESIRRRVLWITPLAILGVIVVSQLQKVFDEQDVLRETTKFCIFASGLVVTLTTIILACTNLPKEIETRVIYTVVTKPATRLELIVGKIIGFSRVSAVILIIMGLFSYGYLSLRAWRQGQEISVRLATDPALSGAERNKLEHYRDSGLLTARDELQADDAQVMAPIDPSAPAARTMPTLQDSTRSIYGDSEEEFLFPFKMDRARFFAAGDDPNTLDEGIGKTGMLIGVRVKWHRYGPDNADPSQSPGKPHAPLITIDLLDHAGYNLVESVTMYDPHYPTAKDVHSGGEEMAAENSMDGKTAPIDQSRLLWAYVPPSQAGVIAAEPSFYVHVYGISHNVQYFADASSVFIVVSPQVPQGHYAPTIALGAEPGADQIIWPDAGPDGKLAPPMVRGRLANRGGQQLVGKPVTNEHAAFALFHFHGAGVLGAEISGESVPLEIESAIEHGGDLEDKGDPDTGVTLYVRPAGGADAGTLSEPIALKMENKQPSFVDIPAKAMGNGDFDVILRCNSPGDVVALEAGSMNLIIHQEPFAWNLAKSLFILWMLTVLVITLSIFSSTFLSWPIAVLLTSVLLMGHWAVMQVADSSDKTLGRSIATDMGLTDPSKAEAVANSVNALSGTLQIVGAALPDIDRFSAISDIERGIVVSARDVGDALGVLVGFGLPATVLGYLLLKNKEVAP